MFDLVSVQSSGEQLCHCFFDMLKIFITAVLFPFEGHLSHSVVHVSTRLADYDVVVTTYSLVSKEIPVQKEEADKPNTDKDDVVNTTYTTGSKASE